MKFSELIDRIDNYVYSTKDYSTNIQFGEPEIDKKTISAKTIFAWIQLNESEDNLIIFCPIHIPLNGVFKITRVLGDNDSLSNFLKFVKSHNAMNAEVKILDFPLLKESIPPDDKFLVHGWCRNIEYIYFTEQQCFIGSKMIAHFITIA